MEDEQIRLAREKVKAKFGNNRTGGKGSVRRKKKTVHKTATSDDKKLTSSLKKLGVSNIPAIEEVNLFKADGKVIHFSAPKVQASIAANTYVISGQSETKELQELLPGIINQLCPDDLSNLKSIAEQLKAPGAGGAGEGGGDGGGDDDDDVPDLVENFEEASGES